MPGCLATLPLRWLTGPASPPGSASAGSSSRTRRPGWAWPRSRYSARRGRFTRSSPGSRPAPRCFWLPPPTAITDARSPGWRACSGTGPACSSPAVFIRSPWPPLRQEGAQVTEVGGSYDQAVRQAAEAAREPSAALVQDTAWPGYEQVPRWIVEGYSTLFAEIDAQLADAGAAPPGLVAVPVGVGSLAQAAITHYRGRSDGPAPALLAVEPDTASCVLASLIHGERVAVPTGTTVMAGLNCGTPSLLAWPYLRDGLDAAVAVTDADSIAAARALAASGIAAGPCGGAALAGARAALTGEGAEARRGALAVEPGTTVVLLSTEGAAANPVPSAAPDDAS